MAPLFIQYRLHVCLSFHCETEVSLYQPLFNFLEEPHVWDFSWPSSSLSLRASIFLFGCNADCEFHPSISETTTIYHVHFLKPCSTGRTLHTSLTRTENKSPLPPTYRFHGWLMTCRVMSSQLGDQSPPIARTPDLNVAAPAVLPVLCNQADLLSVMLHMLSGCC